jgi:TPR repeat protein
MYLDGNGVLQDYTESVKWYRLSAEQGDVGGQYNMGVMYDNGDGVPEDDVLAYMWWDLADSSGDQDALDNRALLEEEMTDLQIQTAKELARNWKSTTI